MLAQAPNMNTVYDFSVIETAIETLAGQAQAGVVWVNGFDAQQLQKSRPRVECYLEQGEAFGDPPHYINTAVDGQRRINGWRGQLKTIVITETLPGPDEATAAKSSYTLHNQYRSFVANFLSTIDQALRDNQTLLPFHQIARCWVTGSSSSIVAQDGYYKSEFNHFLIYSIRPSAYPGGLLNPGQIPTS